MKDEIVTLHYQVLVKEGDKAPKWVWYQHKMPSEKAWAKAQELRIAANVRNIGFGKIKEVV